MAEQPPPPPDDAAAEGELQRSSGLFLAELRRLDEMERRKQIMSPGDAARIPLAQEIEDTTIGLVGMSRYQTRLIEMASQAAGAAGAPGRKTPEILGEWRAAERDLRDARATMERAMDRADALREEHRRSLRSAP